MGLSWAKRRDEQHLPNKAFSKAQKVYGKRMNDAPKTSSEDNVVTTDFDELISYRKKRSAKKDRSASRYMIWLIISIAVFLYVLLVVLLGRS